VPEPGLSHCKLCEAEDFENPELLGVMRDVYSAEVERHADYPKGREERKLWEVAMTARAFRDLGVLGPESRILGVGAGHEATIYWLTRQVGEVVATDLYRTEDSWSETDSDTGMLTDPGQYWNGPWDPDRLVVEHMNALELTYDDESFDGVFSSSSIEHFGHYEDVRKSIEEIFRVLRPGGIAALSTEFRLQGPPPGIPGTLMFDEPELRSVLLDGIWWDPADPLRTEISNETVEGVVPQLEAIEDICAGRDGFRRYPHVVLSNGPYMWTSVHLALVKSRQPTSVWRRRAPELPPRRPFSERMPGAGALSSIRSRLQGLRVRVGAALGRGPG
jgi:SAM-dependent methyltransferase